MSIVTEHQVTLHRRACELLEKDLLEMSERLFVLEHWRDDAEQDKAPHGSFFTPFTLACELSKEVYGTNIIDLCAGIGALAFAVYHSTNPWCLTPAVTCVEINPAYAAVGRKVLPEATWIVGDVLDLSASFGNFDCAIASPPFGGAGQQGKSPRYRGSEFEYKVIDVARDFADYGVYLLPQSSVPFRYSGCLKYEPSPSGTYREFRDSTGLELIFNCGIDTSLYRTDWRESFVASEIVCVNYQR